MRMSSEICKLLILNGLQHGTHIAVTAYMNKQTRNEKILSRLSIGGEESASNLALILDCPVPSVRRSIQELRADGHNISFSGSGSGELYRLGV